MVASPLKCLSGGVQACCQEQSDFIFSIVQEYLVEIRCDAESKGVAFVSQ